MTKFHNVKYLIDTPQNTIQGFVVNMACDDIQLLFSQVNFWFLFKNLVQINSNDLQHSGGSFDFIQE